MGRKEAPIEIQKKGSLYTNFKRKKHFLSDVSNRFSSRLQGASEVCMGNFTFALNTTGALILVETSARKYFFF